MPRNVEEEEIIIIKNSNFKNMLTINSNQNLNQTAEDDLTDDYNATNTDIDTSNGDLAIDYTDSLCLDVTQLDYNGLEITLDYNVNIKDYNIEYYIFTNPYIIIQEPDIKLPMLHTLNFNNHCSNFEKTTIDLNSILADCNIETDFNKTTAFPSYSIEADNIKLINGNVLPLIEKSTTNISIKENTCQFSNFGGI